MLPVRLTWIPVSHPDVPRHGQARGISGAMFEALVEANMALSETKSMCSTMAKRQSGLDAVNAVLRQELTKVCAEKADSQHANTELQGRVEKAEKEAEKEAKRSRESEAATRRELEQELEKLVKRSDDEARRSRESEAATRRQLQWVIEESIVYGGTKERELSGKEHSTID